MIAPEDPPGFVVRTEAQKAAADNGFRLPHGVANGWLRFGSTTAQGDVWIAGIGMHGPWLLALDRPDVAAELPASPAAVAGSPGVAAFVFDTLAALYASLDHVYRLSVSLPDAPLARFAGRAANLPRATEAERLVLQRVGQDVFRQALLDYWGGRCPLTGIADPALLRASHIVPWAECATDAERLDVHNGLLLSALWDAAFDAGLVSFADDGAALVTAALGAEAAAALDIGGGRTLGGLTTEHQVKLAWHRARYGFSAVSADP